jgi:hypothetical protein
MLLEMVVCALVTKEAPEGFDITCSHSGHHQTVTLLLCSPVTRIRKDELLSGGRTLQRGEDDRRQEVVVGWCPFFGLEGGTRGWCLLFAGAATKKKDEGWGVSGNGGKGGGYRANRRQGGGCAG